MSRPRSGNGRLRWYVRLEYPRPMMFGESAREAAQWAVFTYFDRDVDGNPIRVGGRVFLTTFSAAIAHAREQAALVYKALR